MAILLAILVVASLLLAARVIQASVSIYHDQNERVKLGSDTNDMTEQLVASESERNNTK